MAAIGTVTSSGKIHQMLVGMETAHNANNPYQAKLWQQMINNTLQELELKDQKRLIQEQSSRLTQAESKYATAQKELAAAQGKNMEQNYQYQIDLANQKASQAKEFYEWKAKDHAEDLENSVEVQKYNAEINAARAIVEEYGGRTDLDATQRSLLNSALRKLGGIEEHSDVALDESNYLQTQTEAQRRLRDAEAYRQAGEGAEGPSADAARQLSAQERQLHDDLMLSNAGEGGQKLLEERITGRKDFNVENFEHMTEEAKNYITALKNGASKEQLGELLDVMMNKNRSEMYKDLTDIQKFITDNPQYAQQGMAGIQQTLSNMGKQTKSTKPGNFPKFNQSSIMDTIETWRNLPLEEQTLATHTTARKFNTVFRDKYKVNRWFWIPDRWEGGKPGEKLHFNSAVQDLKTLMNAMRYSGIAPSSAVEMLHDLDRMSQGVSLKLPKDASADDQMIATLANIKRHYRPLWDEFRNMVSSMAAMQGERGGPFGDNLNNDVYKAAVLDEFWKMSDGRSFAEWVPKMQQDAQAPVSVPDNPDNPDKKKQAQDSGRSRPQAGDSGIWYNPETESFMRVDITGQVSGSRPQDPGRGYTTGQGVTVGRSDRLFKKGEGVLIPHSIKGKRWPEVIRPGSDVVVNGELYTYKGFDKKRQRVQGKTYRDRYTIKVEDMDGNEQTFALGSNTFSFEENLTADEINAMMAGTPSPVTPKKTQPKDANKPPSEREKKPPKSIPRLRTVL